MTKAHAHKRKQYSKDSTFKFYDNTPTKYKNTLCPLNLNEQKNLFLRNGKSPSFTFDSAEKVESIVKRQKGRIHYHYLKEAVRILELTKEDYGNGSLFLDEALGLSIDEGKATSVLQKYMRANRVEGAFKVLFTKDLSSSARMMWHGPCLKYNKPEARKYTMFVRNTPDNIYLRAKGMQCLANHEIGTHFFRMVNDGFQPWFADRKKFGLRPLKSYELCQTEEGLATVNTVLQYNVPYLQGAALSYYTACKSETMTFQELFDHLETYVADPDRRFRIITRVKRGLVDPSGVGGYGGDQCYFEGAVQILRNIDNIDFNLLYAGKLCLDELERVSRVARLECIRCPRFLKDVEKYKQQLRKIAVFNKLIPRKRGDRAKSDTRSSAFGERKLASPLSLRADTCIALYNPSKEQQHNVSMTSLSLNYIDYTKDPDTGFVYPTPSSSVDALTLGPSTTEMKTTASGQSCSRLLNRPVTDSVKIKKHRSKTASKNKKKKPSSAKVK